MWKNKFQVGVLIIEVKTRPAGRTGRTGLLSSPEDPVNWPAREPIKNRENRSKPGKSAGPVRTFFKNFC